MTRYKYIFNNDLGGRCGITHKGDINNTLTYIGEVIHFRKLNI